MGGGHVGVLNEDGGSLCREQSCSMWMDEADDTWAEAVGVEGADGYEWRRWTYAIEMSGERVSDGY